MREAGADCLVVSLRAETIPVALRQCAKLKDRSDRKMMFDEEDFDSAPCQHGQGHRDEPERNGKQKHRQGEMAPTAAICTGRHTFLSFNLRKHWKIPKNDGSLPSL